PSPAAPVEQKPHRLAHVTLFCRSAAVPGRPRRTEPPPGLPTRLIQLVTLISHSIYYLTLKVELLTCISKTYRTKNSKVPAGTPGAIFHTSMEPPFLNSSHSTWWMLFR